MLMFLLTLTLMLVIIFFALQNADVMTVKFMLWQFELPKAILLFVALLTGALLSALWYVIKYLSFTKQIKELQEALKEKGINTLKENRDKEDNLSN